MFTTNGALGTLQAPHGPPWKAHRTVARPMTVLQFGIAEDAFAPRQIARARRRHGAAAGGGASVPGDRWWLRIW